MLPSPDSHLSHHTGDILLVLGREVGRDLHQQGRLVRALQGVPRLLHLGQQVAQLSLSLKAPQPSGVGTGHIHY